MLKARLPFYCHVHNAILHMSCNSPAYTRFSNLLQHEVMTPSTALWKELGSPSGLVTSFLQLRRLCSLKPTFLNYLPAKQMGATMRSADSRRLTTAEG